VILLKIIRLVLQLPRSTLKSTATPRTLQLPKLARTILFASASLVPAGASLLAVAPAFADPNATVTFNGIQYQINYQTIKWSEVTFNKTAQPWWGSEANARFFASALSQPGVLPGANPTFRGIIGPSVGFEEPSATIITVAYGFRSNQSTQLSPNDINTLVRSYTYVVSAITASSFQPYADMQSIGLDALKNQRELVLNQAGNCDQRGWVVYDSDKGKDPRKPKKNLSFCVFAEGGNATGSINGTSTLGGYDTSNASSAFGVEWKASQQWAIGAAYGYGTTNLGGYNFQDTTASIESNINSGNIYAVYRPDKNWKIAALGGYSGFSYSGNRTFLGDTANSSFSANGYTAAIQASYDIILSKDYNNKKNPLNPVRVRPLVGLAWGGHQQDSFSETGDGTLADVQEQTTNSLMATLGASLEAPIPLNSSKTTVLTPRVGVAYQYDFLANQNGNKSITAVLQDDPTTSFTEVGQNRGANSVYVDLGADLQINPNLVLYAAVNYQAFTNGDQFGYQGGVRVKF
jgi:uncharacterized protein YhjY with autotransporter beta-barrel domain